MMLIQSYMRKIDIKAKGLVDLLEKQGVIANEQHEINKQLIELDKERTKNGYKVQKIKDKMKPIIDGLMKDIELGEFEIVTNIMLEDGQPKMEILDQLEEYAKMLRENKEKK